MMDSTAPSSRATAVPALRALLALLLAFTVLASACGDSDDGETSSTDEGADESTDEGADDGDNAAAEPDGDKPTINFVVNPWTASALNVEVARQIIESELGYPTEAISLDENEAMFTGLSDGTIDAVLEIWPSGITESEQAFFDDGTVVNIGDLGAVGQIGWFVPSYVVEDNPDLAGWEGYKSPEAASLFATAETGDNGRFLGTDPSYSTYDEQIIENLDLPFEVQYSGSEPATVAELDARVSAGEPILMYWWTPTAAVSKYDLVKVDLPAYTDECGASAAAGDGGVDCDYPADPIIKAASPALADKAPDVYSFLEKFTMTSEDQLSMLPAVEIDGEDPEDVAAKWVADNADVWSAWLG